MKIETTVFLSEELVAALGSRAPDPEHRSELVEAALFGQLEAAIQQAWDAQPIAA
jgi:hypothetical protein